MIVEDQLDRGLGRISGIEKLEELDELAAAVAVSDERMDLAGEQINPGQQAQRAMAFVLMIPRKGGVEAGFGRQIRRRRCDGLDARLFVIRDDGHRLAPSLRFGGGRVSGTMCKQVSVSLPYRGDSHDDQCDDYTGTVGSTAREL